MPILMPSCPRGIRVCTSVALWPSVIAAPRKRVRHQIDCWPLWPICIVVVVVVRFTIKYFRCFMRVIYFTYFFTLFILFAVLRVRCCCCYFCCCSCCCCCFGCCIGFVRCRFWMLCGCVNFVTQLRVACMPEHTYNMSAIITTIKTTKHMHKNKNGRNVWWHYGDGLWLPIKYLLFTVQCWLLIYTHTHTHTYAYAHSFTHTYTHSIIALSCNFLEFWNIFDFPVTSHTQIGKQVRCCATFGCR